ARFLESKPNFTLEESDAYQMKRINKFLGANPKERKRKIAYLLQEIEAIQLELAQSQAERIRFFETPPKLDAKTRASIRQEEVDFEYSFTAPPDRIFQDAIAHYTGNGLANMNARLILLRAELRKLGGTALKQIPAEYD
ncbi:MAG: hypothetical protein NUV67_01050, partial [archaeon]|nr:hypothetical protein [archaeon]